MSITDKLRPQNMIDYHNATFRHTFRPNARVQSKITECKFFLMILTFKYWLDLFLALLKTHSIIV